MRFDGETMRVGTGNRLMTSFMSGPAAAGASQPLPTSRIVALIGDASTCIFCDSGRYCDAMPL